MYLLNKAIIHINYFYMKNELLINQNKFNKTILNLKVQLIIK